MCELSVHEVKRMSNVQRVCVRCGEGNPVESRYCAHCGYDSQSSLPAQRVNLPAVIGRAALPVLVGAAGLVVRAGWKLLQSRLAQTPTITIPTPKAAQPVAQQQVVPRPRVEVGSLRRAKRTIHIRSAWSVNNNGVWQQGTSEHTIELDD
jgi:hypothetical protein